MKNILLIIFFAFLISCAQKSKEVVSKIESKGLDEQMQKEVTKIVEIMGSNLASLSEKFVSDYSPLTNQLVNLVNSLGSIKKKTNKKSE